jgi:quinol monooxygenase YgiN
MTVTALLDLHIAPESSAVALDVLEGVLIDTRAFEGCLGVDVIVDVDDPLHVVAVERWQTLAHDDAYRAWRATPAGASTLGSILAAAPTLTRFTS